MTSTVLHDGSPEDVGMDPVKLARVKDLCRGWVACGDTPSLAVLVARRGAVVLHEAFGVLRPEPGAPPLQVDSIFPVASSSKPFTAAAVMCLVEDGLIGLNRAILDYVPELDVPGAESLAEARVADLLCHTAGFDDVELALRSASAWAGRPELPPPGPGQHPVINRLIQLAAGAPLAHRPGEVMLYSNFGYNLLGDIVRRVSGRPFGEFVQHRIFEPLSMASSSFVLTQQHKERRVYRAAGSPATERASGWWRGIDSPEHDEIDSGAGGLATTAGDLAAFAQMLLNRGSYGGRRVLGRTTVDAMARSQVPQDVPLVVAIVDPATGERKDNQVLRGGGYGFGLHLFETGDRYEGNGSLASPGAFGHSGNGGAAFWVDPQEELVGVYLSVSPRMHRDWFLQNGDLFMNAVHAAISD